MRTKIKEVCVCVTEVKKVAHMAHILTIFGKRYVKQCVTEILGWHTRWHTRWHTLAHMAHTPSRRCPPSHAA